MDPNSHEALLRRREAAMLTWRGLAQRHAMEPAMLAGRRRLRQRLALPRHKLRAQTASMPIPGRALRIATGVPVGSDLEYADEVTMHKALTNRHEM
jgi:hypothetical protein